MPGTTPELGAMSGIIFFGSRVIGREPFEQTRGTQEPGKAGLVVDLKQTGGQMKAARMREDVIERQPHDPVRRSFVDDPGPGVFHHVPEANSRGTNRFTRPAIQTTEHVIHEGVGYRGAAFVERPHQVNPSPGRIHFVAEDTVGRAGRQAQPAVNTIQVQFIVAGFESAFHTLSSPSTWRRGFKRPSGSNDLLSCFISSYSRPSRPKADT